MVESSVGALWRADRHRGEGEVRNGMCANGGGDRRVLPFQVRLADEKTSDGEAKPNYQTPSKLASLCLNNRNELM